MRGLVAAIALLVVAPTLAVAQFRGPRAELTPLVESEVRAGGERRGQSFAHDVAVASGADRRLEQVGPLQLLAPELLPGEAIVEAGAAAPVPAK